LNLCVKEIDWHQNCSNPEKQKWEMKTMHKESGFSLFEILTVIAITAILATIAVPNMMAWRHDANLRGAVENLRGDLQLAKLKAVQENGSVTLLFSDNGYQVFIDGANPGVLDSGERLLRNRQLPAGVSIDLGSTDFNGNIYARFNNRGLPDDIGNVVVDSTNGDQRLIGLNRLGRINIQ
jgi:type IV fimbrial biogenesis protein FimT